MHSLRARWEVFRETRRGRRFVKLVRGAFVAAVLAFLAYQLHEIGWREVWTALPDEPLFYVLILAMYLILPAAEGLIYGRLWGLPVHACLPASFKKRVLNQDVLGYSGEVYLYLWARRRTGLSGRQVLATVKDNLVVSSLSSVTAALLLLGLFLVAGLVRVGDFAAGADVVLVAAGVAAFLLVGSAVVGFRKVLFATSTRTLAFLMAVHVGRFVLGWILQIVQWWVVVPEAAFGSWAVLLTAMVLTNRIPFLPSKDLVFVGLGAELASVIGVPSATIAAMLLVRSVSEKALNLALFALTSAWERRYGVPVEADPEDEPAVDAGAFH